MLRTGQDFQRRCVFREFPEGARGQRSGRGHHLRAVGEKAEASNPDRDSPVTGKLVNPPGNRGGRQDRGTGNTGNRSGIAEEKISSSDRVICQRAFFIGAPGGLEASIGDSDTIR